MNSIGDAISDFSLDLYKVIADTGENLCLSPYSVSAALMLTMLGTKGTSESQLLDALKLSGFSAENIHEKYKELNDVINSNRGQHVTLSIANRLFCRLGLDIKSEYSSETVKFYGSKMELLDFIGKPQDSTTQINTWVKENTEGKIRNLIPDGVIDHLTLLVLTNAIYFKGDWARKFKPEETSKKDFFSSQNEVVATDMMQINGKKWLSGISSEFNCKVLEMLYRGVTHSMVLILPHEVDGVSELEGKLSHSSMSKLLSCVRSQNTTVQIPKFKIESSFELQKLLPKLGVVDIFDDEKADFSGMFEDPQPQAYISHVIHKTFIEVTEKGTEAAAATAVVEKDRCMERTPPSTLKFVADHPFLFLIKDNKTGTILFIGRCSKPEGKVKNMNRRISSYSSRSSSEDSFHSPRSTSRNNDRHKRYIRHGSSPETESYGRFTRQRPKRHSSSPEASAYGRSLRPRPKRLSSSPETDRYRRSIQHSPKRLSSSPETDRYGRYIRKRHTRHSSSPETDRYGRFIRHGPKQSHSTHRIRRPYSPTRYGYSTDRYYHNNR